MENIDALREQVNGLLAGSGVQFSYLFGSRATGQATPGSDTDIAVRFDRLALEAMATGGR